MEKVVNVDKVLTLLQKIDKDLESTNERVKKLKENKTKILRFISENQKDFNEFIEISKIDKIIIDKDKEKILINSLIKNNSLFIREKKLIEIEKVQLKNALKNSIEKNEIENINLSFQLRTFLLNNGVKLLTKKDVLKYKDIAETLKEY